MGETILKCPACRTQPLFLRALEAGLTAQACDGCGGRWIRWDDYWDWLDHAPDALPMAAPPPAEDAPAELPAPDEARPAKLCPQCGRLLTRAKVGRGVNFRLERCAACGGMWLDAGEWESLRAAGLHRDLHHVFSPATKPTRGCCSAGSAPTTSAG